MHGSWTSESRRELSRPRAPRSGMPMHCRPVSLPRRRTVPALHAVSQPEFGFPLAAEHAQGETCLAERQLAVLDQPQVDADRLMEGDAHALETAAPQGCGEAREILRR